MIRDIDIAFLCGLVVGLLVGGIAIDTLACAHADPAHVTILSCPGQAVVMGRRSRT